MHKRDGMASDPDETGTDALARSLREHVTPLDDAFAPALDRLIAQIGSARYVLLGEATHGTHEFYAFRAALTKRLIVERGFNAIAVEADWPDAYRVNRFVRGVGDDADARAALSDFQRFPRWMWRNEVVLELVGWLRRHNETAGRKVGFYGIDLYSLHASMDAVLAYLDRTHPTLAAEARERYGCFEPFGDDPQRYGHATSFGYLPSCEEEVARQLMDLHAARVLHAGEGHLAEDEAFFAEQNARVVRNAEEYYRAMFRGGIASWNLRDTHMADTVDALCQHLGQRDAHARIVVWAHNSHLGDARATELGDDGELNLGQLLRQRHPDETFVLGFTTYQGTVTAAEAWEGPAEREDVQPGLRDSYEELFHRTGIPRFLLAPSATPLRDELARPRLQRAIGVVYAPATERLSHYYHTRIADQFDAVVHLDETRALTPLERDSEASEGELPDTFPSGM